MLQSMLTSGRLNTFVQSIWSGRCKLHSDSSGTTRDSNSMISEEISAIWVWQRLTAFGHPIPSYRTRKRLKWLQTLNPMFWSESIRTETSTTLLVWVLCWPVPWILSTIHSTITFVQCRLQVVSSSNQLIYIVLTKLSIDIILDGYTTDDLVLLWKGYESSAFINHYGKRFVEFKYQHTP